LNITFVIGSYTDYYTNVSALVSSAIDHGHIVSKYQTIGIPCQYAVPTIPAALPASDLIIFVGSITNNCVQLCDYLSVRGTPYALLDTAVPWIRCEGKGEKCFGSKYDCLNEDGLCFRCVRELYSEAAFTIGTTISNPINRFTKGLNHIPFGPLIPYRMFLGSARCDVRDSKSYLYVGPTCPLKCDKDCKLKRALNNSIKYADIQEKDLIIPAPMMDISDRCSIYDRYQSTLYVPSEIDLLGTFAIESVLCGCELITTDLCTPFTQKYICGTGRSTTYNLVGMYQHFVRVTGSRSKVINSLRHIQSAFWTTVDGLLSKE